MDAHDVAVIEAELNAAGFHSVEIHTITAKSKAENPRVPAVAYCQGTPLRNELEALDASKIDVVTDLAADDLERKFGSGPISGKIQGHVVFASK